MAIALIKKDLFLKCYNYLRSYIGFHLHYFVVQSLLVTCLTEQIPWN
jgi:hypothetical protein